MRMPSSYKYRIYPTKEQISDFNKTFGCCRFVFNKLLAENIEAYKKYEENKNHLLKPKITEITLKNRLTQIRNEPELSWLKEVSAASIRTSATRLYLAFNNFFKSNGRFPKFKKKSNKDSIEYTNQDSHIRDGKLILVRINNPIKINFHRPLPSGKRTSCVITREPSGKYFAIFTIECEIKKTEGKGYLGIDAGITDLYTFSDGTTIPNPRFYIKSQKKLIILSRRHSRTKKGSKNREKARLRLALLYEKITNQRNDYLHKLSTRIIRENQAVCIESLMISNMVRNHKLAKHITDAGWGIFRKMLSYKALQSTGCKLYMADPFYPSTQLCSSCGVKPDKKIKLGVTKWICVECGTIHKRDPNASQNLLHLCKRMHELYSNEAKNVILVPSYA